MALESADKEKFYEILQSPHLEISHYIDEYAVPLYYQEMKDDRVESHVSLYIYVKTFCFLEMKRVVKILCNMKHLYEKLLFLFSLISWNLFN